MYHSSNNLIDPHLLFEKAHLQPGMHVADLGCGKTGHIVFPAARVLGEAGLVYAVDIIKDFLEEIRKRSALEAMHNIQTVWSDLERLGKAAIPNKNLDIGFIINVLWHSANPVAILDEAKRMLKEKARLVVVDWHNAVLPIGPKDSQLVDFEKIKSWGKVNNFVVQEEFLMGNYHKGVVLYKHD
ncbi:MAG: methyltransferase domain-containing protein [Candidatus Magasanikiibacteriota bacterium]